MIPNGLSRKKLWKSAALSSFLLPAALLSQPLSAQAVDMPGESQTVTIQFEGAVGDAPFACGETYQIGTANSAVTLSDFRLYVSEVALINAAGNAVPLVLEQDGLWQHQNVALLDFEDKTGACTNGTTETRAQVIGSVPAGEYSGLKLTLGVPFALNHLDSTLAPSPLNLTSLWWNWNAGYKFARIEWRTVTDTADMSDEQLSQISRTKNEGHSEEEHSEGGHSEGEQNADAAQAFAFHLGSVGCQMDSAQAPVQCSVPNRSEIMLTDFDPTQDVVVADLSELFADNNLSANQDGTAAGCMSNPSDSDCGGIMQNLGLPFADQPPSEQTFFRLK